MYIVSIKRLDKLVPDLNQRHLLFTMAIFLGEVRLLETSKVFRELNELKVTDKPH